MDNTEEICRSCLTTEEDLFKMNSIIEESLKISDCLKIHLNISIAEDDGLPYYICSECLDTVLTIRKFHLKYMESEAFLLDQCTKLSLQKVDESDTSIKDESLANADESMQTYSESFEPVENLLAHSDTDQFKTEVNTKVMGVLPCNNWIPYTIEFLDETCESIADADGDELIIKEFTLKDEVAETASILADTIEENSDTNAGSCKPTKPFKCLQCKEEFPNKNDLRSHFNSVHGDDNARGFCIQCSSTFPTRGHLMKHLQTHIEKPKLTCEFCGKGFLGMTKLLTHKRIHTGEKPYVCRICNKSFSQSSVLATHMALHTGKQVECPKCDKKFSRQSFLKVHLRVHDDIRPYKCHMCEKKYRMKSHLNSHLLAHSDERKFQCEVCGQKFNERTILRSHMNVHIRPYKCPKCPLQAAKLYSFRLHLVKMHGIHDDPKLFMIPTLPEFIKDN